MASTWTKKQSVEISDIKSAILANAEAIKENREAIRTFDHKIDEVKQELKQKFKSEINNLENRLINVLARNGIK